MIEGIKDVIRRVDEQNFYLDVITDPNDGSQTVVITGACFTLPRLPSEAWSARALILRGYEITLTEDLDLSGRTVTLFCRFLILAKGRVAITVDGEDAPETAPSRKAGSRNEVGGNGLDGADGNKGGDAGLINIYCERISGGKLSLSAVGGRGGWGQDGGDGRTGRSGSDGVPPTLVTAGENRASPAGNGGRGGAAGYGGSAGQGGKGGVVTVLHPPAPVAPTTVDVAVNGGEPGDPGEAGARGQGGRRGNGGLSKTCIMIDIVKSVYTSHLAAPTPSNFLHCTDKKEPDGKPGGLGPEADVGAEADAGAPGNSKMEAAPASAGTALTSLAHLRLLLHEAELHYINQEWPQAADMLQWLIALTDRPARIGAPTNEGLGQLAVEGRRYEDITSIRSRSITLLHQMTQGLNFYGLTAEFTYLVRFETSRLFLDRLMSSADTLEKAYKFYRESDFDDAVQRGELRRAIVSIENTIQEHRSQISALKDQRQGLANEITDLIAEQDRLRVALESAREELTRALSAEAGCSFSELLSAATAVASIASGAGAIYGGLKAGFEAMKQFETADINASLIDQAEHLIGQAEFIVKEFKPVAGGVNEIREGYHEIKSVLDMNVNADAAKLLVSHGDVLASRDRFIQVAESFPQVEEAQRMKALVEDFAAVIELKNRHILESDSLLSRILELGSLIEELNLAVDAQSALLVDQFNPVLIDHVAFFRRSITDLRAKIMRELILLNRHLNYSAATDSALAMDVRDDSVARLTTYLADVDARRLRMLQVRNQALFQMDAPPQIDLTRESAPTQFEALDQTSQLRLRINPDSPSFIGYSHVQIERVEVRFEGDVARLDSVTWVRLIHEGDPTVIDEHDRRHRFAHLPRSITKSPTSMAKRLSFSWVDESQQYSPLCPFATWRLEFLAGNGELADLQGALNGISFIVHGRALSRNIAPG